MFFYRTKDSEVNSTCLLNKTAERATLRCITAAKTIYNNCL